MRTRQTPVVLGILSIVFGCLTVLGSAFDSLSQWWLRNHLTQGWNLPQKAGQPDLAPLLKRAEEVTEQLRPVLLTEQGGMVALSAILILVGLGLHARRAWSRRAALAWSIAALAFLGVRIYLEWAVVAPRMQAPLRAAIAATGLPPSILGSEMEGFAKTIGLALFYAPFPLLLLWLMGRSSARDDLDA